MTVETDLTLLRDLCAAASPTGYEGPVQAVVRRRLAAVAAPEGDPLGNVWADVVPDGGPHVLVTGHCDQIGFLVTYVDDQGFVSFDKIGGVDQQLTPGRRLVIHGSRGPVDGVVGRKPTHIVPRDERGKAPAFHEQWIDIGARTREEALALVAVGDAITFEAAFLELANRRYASPAFDDRAGLYVAVRAFEHYAAQPATARLTALSTVHEETTFMGARAAALRWRPQVVVVLEVDFASDDPGVDPKRLGGEVKLGGGPIIHLGSGSNAALARLAREVADGEGIPYQLKASPGATSTDAEELMAAGETATLSLSVPLRYMHSALEVIQPDDAEWAARLTAALTRRLAADWTPERFVPDV
jgi:endoglucanase